MNQAVVKLAVLLFYASGTQSSTAIFKFIDGQCRHKSNEKVLGFNDYYVGECGTEQELRMYNKKLTSKNINGAKFTYSSLQSIDLSHASLIQLNLYSAFIRKTSFTGANLSEAKLSGAEIRGCDFSRANLDSALIRGARVYETQFMSANLRGADLRGTYFESSNFASADLRGANISNSFFVQSSFENAIYNNKTVLPFSEIDAKRKGMVFVK